MSKNLTNYLNNLIFEFTRCSTQKANVSFYDNGARQLLSQLKIDLPFSKVLIVAKEGTFLSIGKTLKESLEKQGHKVITVLYEDIIHNCIDDTLPLFSTPEDVRATILLDADLAKLNNYFVSNKNIATYFLLYSIGGFNLFNTEISLYNGGDIDFISLSNLNIKVFIEELNLKSQLANLFSELFCGLISFYDYRINGFITNEKLNATIFNTTTKSIMEGYSSVRTKENLTKLIRAYFSICIANAFTLGKVCNFSSVSVLQEMLGNSPELKIYSAILVLQFYSIYFNSDTTQVLGVADYNEIAKVLSEKTKIKEKHFLSSLKEQLKKINPNAIGELKNKLKTEIRNLVLIKDNVFSHYLYLGGKSITESKAEEIKKYLVYAGDFYNVINGLSLLREDGVFSQF